MIRVKTGARTGGHKENQGEKKKKKKVTGKERDNLEIIIS